MRKFKVLCLLNILSIVFLLTSCGNERHEKSVIALDTVITLMAEGSNSKEVLEEAVDFIKQLDKKANFDENSELSRLNRASANIYTEVSAEIYEMLEIAKFCGDFTKYAYDVSAGSLTLLWDKARENEELPKAEEVEFAKSSVNADNIILKDGKVKKSISDVKVTVGGIAKGYAADKLYSLYKVNNISGFMNFGTSTILALGEKEYRVGIRNPRDEKNMLGVVSLKNEVLSTSGDYERYFIKNSVRYHHIIDPKTGYPANNSIASATVIIPLSEKNAGAMSDALSTALVVKGEKASDILPPFAKALIVTTNGKLIFYNGFKLEK